MSVTKWINIRSEGQTWVNGIIHFLCIIHLRVIGLQECRKINVHRCRYFDADSLQCIEYATIIEEIVAKTL